MSIKELLAVLADEVNEADELLNKELNILTSTESGSEIWTNAFDNYSSQVLRIAETAEMLEFSGMNQLCCMVLENFAAVAEMETESTQLKLLADWPALLKNWLLHPHQQESTAELIEHFCHEQWLFPLKEDQALELVETLHQDIGAADSSYRIEQESQARPVQVTEADISLEFATDITMDLLESFLQEAPEHTANYSQAIQQVLQSDLDKGEQEISRIDDARRIIHTLKGAANTLGVKGIANLCHHTEDILDYLVQEGISPSPVLGDLLLRIADQLEAMVSSLMGEEEAPAERKELLTEVLDCARRIDQGDDPDQFSRQESLVTMQETPVTSSQSDTIEVSNTVVTQPEIVIENLPSDPPKTAMLHIASSHVDTLIRHAGEITISQRQMEGQLSHIDTQLQQLLTQKTALQKRINQLQDLVDIQGVGAAVDKSSAAGKTQSPQLDSLEMDRYNELHNHTHAFIESFSDFNIMGEQFTEQINRLNRHLSDQARINSELHQGLLQARMIPVAHIEGRLQRALRNTCHLTGKQVVLELIGQDIMVDSYVLGAITEPLIHLLRNAVDHGIETEDERLLANKDSHGNVRIIFSNEGNKILIRCIDDGNGLDLDNIRNKAFEQGRLKESQPVTNEELAKMVLIPGFSTAHELTQTSGRGVGMDVVNDSISKLKGAIDLINHPGIGLEINLRLPVTLTTIDVLLVNVENDTIALLVDEVEQVIHRGAKNIKELGNSWVYHAEDAAYPVRQLAELLDYPTENGLGNREDTRPLLLIRSGERHVCLLVDEVLDAQELVMKKPGKHLSRLPGVIGISILGDGRVTPVMDVLKLLERKVSNSWSHQLNQSGTDVHSVQETDILVVDDSLSIRQSLSQLLNDAGFCTHTARDGFEAINSINEQLPSIMLVDMEMPRMNGLELSEHIRAQDITRDIPIIMISSRSQETHIERAFQAGIDDYLTKPYQDQALLDLIQKHLNKGTHI